MYIYLNFFRNKSSIKINCTAITHSHDKRVRNKIDKNAIIFLCQIGDYELNFSDSLHSAEIKGIY